MVAVVDEQLVRDDQQEDVKQEAKDFVKTVKSETKSIGASLSGLKAEKDKKGKVVDYREGITGLLQIPAFALGAAGQFKPEFALDSAAVMLYTPSVAEAINDIAKEDERVAAVLDKVLKVGPYGALLAALLPLTLQIAANHKKVPIVPSLGILDPEALIAKLTGEQPDDRDHQS